MLKDLVNTFIVSDIIFDSPLGGVFQATDANTRVL